MLLLVPACTSDPLEFPPWTIPIPGGTPIREYAAVPIEARDEQIEMVEDLVIGGDAGEPESLLYPRGYTDSAIAVDEQGRIFVLDNGNSRVKVFDAADGSFLFSIGRSGEGPGEFQRATKATIAGARLVIVDSGAPKLSFWSLEGENVADVPAQMSRLAWSVSGFSDGTIAMRFSDRREDERVIVLARFDARGTELGRYLVWPAPKLDFVQVSGRNLTLSHVGPEATFAVGPGDRIYVTAASEYQVAALDRAGNPQWALRVAWPAPPFPQERIDQTIQRLQERFPEITASVFDWPERLPVLSLLRVDGHDHLYVFPYVGESELEEEGRRPVDVYSRDGDHLFSGFVQSSWEAADGDFVYTYEERAETDEWAVVRYRLVEGFE